MGNAIPNSVAGLFDDVDKEKVTAEQLLDKIHDTSCDNLLELRLAFRAVDADGNGSLTQDELCAALERYGFPVDGELRADLWAILDKNDDGRVSYGEFLRVVRGRDYTHAPQGSNPMALPEVLTTQEALLRISVQLDGKVSALRETFEKADKDNSGTLTEDELLACLRERGFDLTEDMNRRIFESFDFDGDGAVKFYELVRTLQSDLGTGGAAAPGEDAGGKAAVGEEEALNRAALEAPGRVRLTADKVKPEEIFQKIHDKMVDGGGRLATLFDKYDADGNGKLSYVEIGKLFNDYGFKLDDELMTHMLKILDKDLSGNVEKGELLRVLRSQDYSHGKPTNPTILYPQLTTEEALLRVRNAAHMNALQSIKGIFKKGDVNNDGTLEPSEFKACLEKLGLTVDEAMSQRIFNAFDRDGNGKMAYHEFIRTVNSGRLV